MRLTRPCRAAVMLVGAAALAFTVFFAWFAIERHNGLMTHTADLGQIDLAIWNTLHGCFVQEVKGEAISTRLTDHIEPIFWPVSVVFGLWDDARALLSLQALVLGMTALVVAGAVYAWWPGRLTTAGCLAATWAALAYLAAPATQAATVADFHASPLAVLPLALLLLTGRRGRTWPALVAAGTALAVKEEIALVVAVACLVLAVTSRWKAGYPAAALALAWFLLATMVIIPSYSAEAYGEATMPYLARYEASETTGDPSLPALVTGVLRRALESDRLLYVAGLLASFAFLPLFAPEVALVAAPLIAANVLSHYSAQFSGQFHYSAPFMSVLAIAAGVGATRVLGWAWRRSHLLSGLVLAAALLVPAVHHMDAGFTPLGAEYYLHRPTSSRADLLERFRPLIGQQASLSVTPALHPHLSHRQHIYTFPDLGEADYVLLDVAGTTDMHPADVRQSFDALLAGGYGIVDADAGMVLLARGQGGEQLPSRFFRFAGTDRAPAHRLEVQFGTSLRLLGYDWLDDPKWGYTYMRLYWEALAPLTDELMPHFLLVDGAGEVITDSRSTPFLEPHWLPLSRWTPGQVWITTSLPAALGDAWGAYVGVVVDGQYDQTAARLSPSASGAGQVVSSTNLVRLDPVQRVRAGLRPSLKPLAVLPPPDQGQATPLGGWLHFHGARVPGRIAPGEALAVTSYWSRPSAADFELALSIRLLDSTGVVAAQIDGPVQQGLYPPRAWIAGEIVPDRKTLSDASELGSGQYTVIVIPYDPATGAPLESVGSGLVLGTVVVVPADVTP